MDDSSCTPAQRGSIVLAHDKYAEIPQVSEAVYEFLVKAELLRCFYSSSTGEITVSQHNGNNWREQGQDMVDIEVDSKQ